MDVLSRTARMSEGFNKWRNAGFKGYANYPPRFGKTTFGVKCITTMIPHNHNNLPIIVVIPNSA